MCVTQQACIYTRRSLCLPVAAPLQILQLFLPCFFFLLLLDISASWTLFSSSLFFLSFSSVTLPPLNLPLCTWRCRQHMNSNSVPVSCISSTLIRCDYCLPSETQSGIASWYAPTLVKWDVSPLCALANTGGFCVYVCVCVSTVSKRGKRVQQRERISMVC